MLNRLLNLIRPKTVISMRDITSMTKLEKDDCYGDYIMDKNELLYRFPTIPNGDVLDCETREMRFSSLINMRQYSIEYTVDKDGNIKFHESCDIKIK